jgi:acyl carrier protein
MDKFANEISRHVWQTKYRFTDPVMCEHSIADTWRRVARARTRFSRTSVNPAADLREAIDIDSMDFLNFVIAIHHRLGIDIPEIDYPKLVTLDGAFAYIAAKLGSSKTITSSSAN